MEMMKQLNKHKLDFDLVWEYVQDDLDKTNALSSELLNSLAFKDGYFFTLLPDDANLKNIYDFKGGLVLPQYPEEEHIVNDHRSTYSWVPDIEDEMSHLILKEIKSKDDLSCIFDNVSGTASDIYYIHFSDAHPLFYEKEVYFLLEQNNLSIELVLKCLKASFSFWHSLCVFTTADFTNVSKNLSLEKINEICLTIELVMIGAYDGEGYVFWEKKLTNASKGFFAE
jgi:hypothetical protein